MNASSTSSTFFTSALKFRLCSLSKSYSSPLRSQAFRSFTTSRATRDERFRPFYVTSPIFYVNAEPHVGHLYTILLADVLKRWQVLKGDTEAALLTGTDEHGMKVQKAAEKLGMSPKQLCDTNAEHFHHLADKANVSYDRFIRTTDQDHKIAVEHFWKELVKRGYIYESKHEGWYSVSDETFYPESQVHLIIDPPTGRKIHASMETGKEVEWTSEINYHFRLSAFKDRLLEHYEQHPNFIVPVQRMNALRKEVAAGLKDLSVSRPSSRLQWGIRVPGDESQTIYVWLDALINYITATAYPHGEGDTHKLWPPNVQVIGKDIIRFHCIYWPAFLMALDLPLPRAFLTHAHWTMGNTKMSKSLGNGVNPFIAIKRYGLDSIRYFMVHDGGIANDADYDNSYIVEKYKRGLQDGLGNLMARLLRAKSWNIGYAVQHMAEQNVRPSDNPTAFPTAWIADLVRLADEAMQELNPRLALQTIMQIVYDANKYFSDAEPWVLVRNRSRYDQLQQIIFAASESARIACILLQPFIPDKAREALDYLDVAQDKRTFQHAQYGGDYSYGQNASERESFLSRDKVNRRYNTLFPPLVTEF